MDFPFRVACVDMGSNAIRYAAEEFSDQRSFRLLFSQRRAARPGHGVDLSGSEAKL